MVWWWVQTYLIKHLQNKSSDLWLVCLTERLTDGQADKQTDWLKNRLMDRVTNWPKDQPTNQPTDHIEKNWMEIWDKWMDEYQHCFIGAHKKTGFKSLKWKVPDHPQRIYSICSCKHTKNPPFCDATHVNLPAVVTERQKNCKSAHKDDMKLCTGCGWVPKW